MERAQDRVNKNTRSVRCRFPIYGNQIMFGMHKALPHEEALAEHGPGIRRAFTYKALNKLIQGSAADMTKKAMVELYIKKVSHLTYPGHDELDISVNNNADKIKEIMEHAVEFKSP